MQQISALSFNPDDTVDVRMTIREYLEMMSFFSAPKKQNVGKGLTDLMTIFRCSRSKAYHISHSEWFKPAILYREGKSLTFDIDVARDLAKRLSEQYPQTDGLNR